EQERPVVGEDLSQEYPDPARGVQPVVEEPAGAAEDLASCSAHPISQKAGPTGSWKSLVAIRYPFESTPIGSCGSGRGAGPNSTVAPAVASNVDWWQGHRMWWVVF